LQYPICIANRKNKIITQTFIDNDKTRFWIAQLVTDIKNISDATPLFARSKEIAAAAAAAL